MPKEQLTTFTFVRHVSGVWSIAATIYFMLTGEAPREIMKGESPAEAVIRGQIISIKRRDPQIPTRIANIIDETLERSEEHTSELQSPYVISYAVFCLKK